MSIQALEYKKKTCKVNDKNFEKTITQEKSVHTDYLEGLKPTEASANIWQGSGRTYFPSERTTNL